ncbi:MAG: hypothetical protein WCE20_11890 [Rhizomicrobium sp.]|jgi:hypothetical protein
MTSSTKTPSTAETQEADKGAISDDRKHLFDRIEDINRAWLDRMREMRGVEAEFSAKLFASKGPEDAMAVCNQWMAKRLEILGAEQQMFAKSWVDMVGLLSDTTKAAFQKGRKR